MAFQYDIHTRGFFSNFLFHSLFQFIHISFISVPGFVFSCVKLFTKNASIHIYYAQFLPVLCMFFNYFTDSCFSCTRSTSQGNNHNISRNASMTFSFCALVPTDIRISDLPAPLKDVQSRIIIPFFNKDSETSFALRGDTSIMIKLASLGYTLQSDPSAFESCIRPFFTVLMLFFRYSLSPRAADPAAEDNTSIENGVITFIYSLAIHSGTTA